MSHLQRVTGRFAVLAALTAACIGVTYAAQPAGADDAAIKAKVQAALHADSNLYARHVDVSVKNGIVHLDGFVTSDRELQLLKRDAASVPGVQNVDSAVTLKPGSPESSTSGG